MKHAASILMTVLISLGMTACSKPAAPVNPAAPLEATFTFLPQKDTRTIIIMKDSVVVVRKNQRDSLLSRRVAPLVDSTKSLRDSLYAHFGRTEPKIYKREGVIDGTIIVIGQPGRTITCRNCLNDYILQAAGKKSAYSSATLDELRAIVVLINRLSSFDEIASRPKRDRVEIRIAPNSKGSSGGAFTVLHLDSTYSTKHK